MAAGKHEQDTNARSHTGLSAWAPLTSRAFAVIWLATLISNTGMWARDVASGWLMSDLSASPLLVALVQAALTLPVFLLAVPGGALADIVDRRRMLIVAQGLLLCVSVALAAATASGIMTPAILLGLTFVGGIGAALIQPVFQAVVPELVPAPLLRPAVALNSMGINIARAVGPVLGGAVLVSAGAAATYLLDAASSVIVILAFFWWRRDASPPRLPAESFWPAVTTGLRYAAHSSDLKRVLIRAAAFFPFASAYWALLPLIARDLLGADASFYGLMLTAIGVGAVTGAVFLPRVHARLSANATIFAGTLLSAFVMAALAFAPSKPATLGLLFVGGAAWIAVLTNLNVAAQAALPNWVRARGMAVYLTVFFGAMAAGSAIWGQTAQMASIPAALLIAAAGAAGVGAIATRIGLDREEADRTPSGHWPDPILMPPTAAERGPVLVTIDWQIDPTERDAFLADLIAFSHRRRRDGSFSWEVFEDPALPNVFTEAFQVRSWLDHLRQHARVTEDDRRAQERLRAFHRGAAPPIIRHLIAARPKDARPVLLLQPIKD